MFGPSSSTFSTLPHDHHRMRQRALLPFFSKRSVDQLEPTIQSIVDDLCVNMEKHHRAHKLINLYYAFSAVSTDVICHYAFGKRYHNVDKEDFGKEWYEMMSSPAQLTPILKQYGWIFYLLVATPQWLVKKTHRVFYNMLIVQKVQFYSLLHDIILNKTHGRNGQLKSKRFLMVRANRRMMPTTGPYSMRSYKATSLRRKRPSNA